ncbi:MAG: copper homeostasis protein CutC [Bacteroidetes bacterium]|nr:copper homeostasis protein CutC [Bacteroidota bacterium]MCL2303035.1 copper homeostasis protein CutC [Lentimicrobiaceae bacterium]
MKISPIIEVCAATVEAAIAANRSEADRIELCQDIENGGTTPSHGAIEFCVNNLSLKTCVLVRPRAGNFVYSDAEFEVIKNDVLHCKRLGIHAVVVGFLHNDFTIDINKTAEIVSLAKPMEVTFHRAFDDCADWKIALEQIIECGCTRILTSGQKPTAVEGAENIKLMVKQAGDRIIILPASGITMENYQQLVDFTGVKEVHGTRLRGGD